MMPCPLFNFWCSEMSALSDPRISPMWTVFLAAGALTIAALMSAQRLQTVTYERGNNDIAQARASSCRVLAEDTVQLGAYYFQPTAQVDGKLTGDLLGEGTYICDGFGGSARIERGGFAQFVRTGDVVEMNKVIQQRLQDPANPDSSPMSRPRLDKSRPIYRFQPQPTTVQNELFNLK